ncbi:methionine biosynthesis protein MetW [Brevundimonas sp.]|uniref:methionine biosynthesis protein MetW n=1 Tax=Brevundimonas sp. TaxID=1871086 RepID=UPI002FC78CF2
MQKFERVAGIIERYAGKDLRMLDIGCRRKGLQPFVQHLGTYHGADLFQSGTVEYVGDFALGLPVEDQAYDVTLALDVIEHTTDMVVALDEMLRVTRRFGIVVLPNHAHWTFRLNLLFTGRIGDKFDIQYPLNLDRHRWFTTAVQSDAFIRDYTAARGFGLTILDSGLGRFGPIIERSIGRLWPNLFNKNQMYLISRDPV